MLLPGAVVALLFAVGATWVVVRGLQARSALDEAQQQLPALRAAIVADDQPTAGRLLAQVAAETGRASRLTGDPVWSAYGHLPVVGASLRTSAGLAAAANRLSTAVLPSLVAAGRLLDPATLRSGGAAIRLAPFEAAQPSLQLAATATAAALADVDALPSAGLVHQVASARASLLGQLTTLVGTTHTAATTAAVLPSMLGADGPRTYFLAFENNAESRGTGGLMGAFGVAVADKGVITVTRTGSDAELSQYAEPVVSLGPEFDRLYGVFGAATDLRESNMSPHFPDAAQIWAAMWQRQSHHTVDGVLALDPVAMAGILDATGPATLADGSKVTGADVVELTEQKAYDTFSDENTRKQFLQQVARAMFAQVVTGKGNPEALLAQLGSAVGSGHLRLWSAHADEQQELATLPIAGVLTTTPGPYAQLVVNNAAGGKLDYYLGRSVTYAASACSGAQRSSTITVTLTNNAPKSGLSAYVLTRSDNPGHAFPPGQNRTLVSIYVAVGAQLVSASLNGRPATLEATVERSHPRFSTYLDLDPGASGTLVLHLQEPATPTGATVPVQPLVLPQLTHVSVLRCR